MAIRSRWLLATALLVTVGPVALADEIELTLNTSAVIGISSPNDKFWGEYINNLDGSVRIDHPEAFGTASVPFHNLSLSVPTGSVITSAFINIFVPLGEYQGTGFIVVELPGLGPHPLDPNAPSVAPIFSTTGISEIMADANFGIGVGALINGDTASTNLQNLTISYVGSIQSAVEVPGSNWGSYLGGFGQVEIPYTVQLDVTYTPPVPEPSTFALLGTGILGLAGVARRKFL